MKRLIAFDLDGTLAASKQPIAPDMAGLLRDLLAVAEVAVISGGDWPQFDKQVVSRLPKDADLGRLFIMPTTGTKLYRHQDGGWRQVYAELFTPEESARIRDALAKAATDLGFDGDRTWGDRIEDRGSQLTWSALGQQAPLDAKEAWDPDRKKRLAIQAAVAKALPGLSVRTGGSTSIDITREGVDKAYAMRKLQDASGVPGEQMLFMGDAIYEGGNDEAVRAGGWDTIKVRDPAETATATRAVIACLR